MDIDYKKLGMEARERFKVTYLKACETWAFFFDKFWGTSDLEKLEDILDSRYEVFTVSVTRQMMRNEKLSWKQLEIMARVYAKKCGPDGSRAYSEAHDDFFHKVSKSYK